MSTLIEAGIQGVDMRPLQKTERDVAGYVGRVFMRYAQPETHENPVLPDRIIGPMIRYAHEFESIYPHAPTFASMALYLEQRSQEPISPEPDETEMGVQVERFTRPLGNVDSYSLFRAYRFIHPRRYNRANLERLKAEFYTTIADIKLDHSVADFYELLATNILFSLGRHNLATSNLYDAEGNIDTSQVVVDQRRKLHKYWIQLAEKEGKKADSDASIIESANAFANLHAQALERYGYGLELDTTEMVQDHPEEPVA